MTAVIPDAEDQGLVWVIVRQGSMAMGDPPQYWSSSHGWGPIGQADTHDIHEVRGGEVSFPTDGLWARVHACTYQQPSSASESSSPATTDNVADTNNHQPKGET